jgi:hypothetical protein
MKTDDPKITTLQAKVTAAQQEFDLAVAFHEIWKPAAYDKDLHGRLGISYARPFTLSVPLSGGS